MHMFGVCNLNLYSFAPLHCLLLLSGQQHSMVAALQHATVIHDLRYPTLSRAVLVGLRLHAMKMSDVSK